MATLGDSEQVQMVMASTPEQDRVKTLLCDTIGMLCKNGLTFKKRLRIQGLIGITIDDYEVLLIQIAEGFDHSGYGEPRRTSLTNDGRPSNHCTGITGVGLHARMKSPQAGNPQHSRRSKIAAIRTRSSATLYPILKSELSTSSDHMVATEKVAVAEEIISQSVPPGGFSTMLKTENSRNNEIQEVIDIDEEQDGSYEAVQYQLHNNSDGAEGEQGICDSVENLMPAYDNSGGYLKGRSSIGRTPNIKGEVEDDVVENPSYDEGMGNEDSEGWVHQDYEESEMGIEEQHNVYDTWPMEGKRIPRASGNWASHNGRRPAAAFNRRARATQQEHGDSAYNATKSLHECLYPGCNKQFRHKQHLLRHQTHKHNRAPSRFLAYNRYWKPASSVHDQASLPPPIE